MVHLRSIPISLHISNSRDQFKSLFDPTNPLAFVTAPIQGVRIKSVMKNGDRNAERPQPPDDDGTLVQAIIALQPFCPAQEHWARTSNKSLTAAPFVSATIAGPAFQAWLLAR
jgi:hypothetical protein